MRWGIATIIAVVVLAAFVILRLGSQGLAYDRHLAEGVEELQVAAGGDADAYPRAADSFREASVLSFLDDYPVFLLSATNRMQSIRAGKPDDMPNQPYYEAMSQGEFDEGCRLAADFEAERAAEYAVRLCKTMRGSDEEPVQ